MKILGVENLRKGTRWIDYTSLSTLASCPRAHFWRSKVGAVSVNSAPLINGKAYHEARAVFRQAIKEGAEFIEAKKSALASIIPIMQEIPEGDPVRNLTVAYETLDNYFERWKDDITYKPVLIEVGFAFIVPETDLLVVGKIDEIADSPFGRVIIEFKTTSIVGSKWSSRGVVNLQLDIYTTALYLNTGEMPFGAVMDVVPLHADKKKRQEPFRIGPTPRSKEHIDETLRNLIVWHETFKRYESINFWPKASQETCTPLVGYTCRYLKLCELNPFPFSGKPLQISGDYKIEFWSPLEELSKGV